MIRRVQNLMRRKWSLAILACLAFLAFLALFFWMHREAEWLEVRRESIHLAAWRGEKPLRILHLSDLHASDCVPWSLLEKAVDIGLAEHPDLVLITGDFVTNPYMVPDRGRYLALLQRLSSAVPSFACLGNHDMLPEEETTLASPVLSLLQAANISLLRNTVADIAIHGEIVHLAGTGDLWSGELKPQRCLQRQRTTPGLILLLSHNPDGLEELADRDWDILLCGHTHGGQLKILGCRPLSPTRRHDHLAGLGTTSAGRLVETTTGVGNLHGLRLNCSPEVVLLEVHGR